MFCSNSKEIQFIEYYFLKYRFIGYWKKMAYFKTNIRHDVAGKNVHTLTHIGRNGGVGAQSEVNLIRVGGCGHS